MEHWAQTCDGAGVNPSEQSKVCMERDRLSEALGRANADAAHMERLHEMATKERDAMAKRLVAAKTELIETKAALAGAKLSMKALNEKLVEITAERDALAKILRKSDLACDYCSYGTEEHAAPCGEDVLVVGCDQCTHKRTICCPCEDGSNFVFAGVDKGGEGQ